MIGQLMNLEQLLECELAKENKPITVAMLSKA
jgi:hypothetical protein